MKFNTIEELLKYTSNLIGKTFEEIDSKNILKNATLNKNEILYHVIGSGFYNYPLNRDGRLYFEELGIELKVCGYIKNKDGNLRAKERLVLSKIDYNKIINETFENSNVLGKCEKMLIIWYKYDSSKTAKDFLITNYQLYDMENDKEIFKNDFEIIKSKVLNGNAHELSEGDTSYLGACTETKPSKDKIKQPFSDILSRPRMYSLKNAYMTGILREGFENNLNIKLNNKTHGKDIIKGNISYKIGETHFHKENLLKSNTSDKTTNKITQQTLDMFSKKKISESKMNNKLNEKNKEISINKPKKFRTVEEYVEDKLRPYFGKTQLEILEELTGKKYEDKIPKGISKQISDILIGKDKDLPQKDELFTKTSFIIKNLPIQENGNARERMSFKTISISEFEGEWENSFWKKYFEETTIITICYAEVNRSRNGHRILKDVKKITFNENDLCEFEKTYNLIKIAIKNKDIALLPTSSNGFKNLTLEIGPKSFKGPHPYNSFFMRNKTKVAFMISKKLLNKKLHGT